MVVFVDFDRTVDDSAQTGTQRVTGDQLYFLRKAVRESIVGLSAEMFHRHTCYEPYRRFTRQSGDGGILLQPRDLAWVIVEIRGARVQAVGFRAHIREALRLNRCAGSAFNDETYHRDAPGHRWSWPDVTREPQTVIVYMRGSTIQVSKALQAILRGPASPHAPIDIGYFVATWYPEIGFPRDLREPSFGERHMRQKAHYANVGYPVHYRDRPEWHPPEETRAQPNFNGFAFETIGVGAGAVALGAHH